MKRNVAFFFVIACVLFTVEVAKADIECVFPNSSTGSSQAVVVDAAPLAHTTQILPLNGKNEIVGRGDVRKQAKQVLENLNAVLKRAKSDRQKVVRLNVYIAGSELRSAVSEVLAQEFDGKTKPAMTFVAGDMVHPDFLVTMDAVAVSKISSKTSSPVHITGQRANHRVSEVSILPPDGAVYVAGLAAKNDLKSATRETMEKIESAIAHLGLKRSDIVQLKAFVTPISQANVVQAEIASFFGSDTVPPVIYVDWISASVPVEIEAIAAAPATSSDKTVTYHTPAGISASPVYSRLARVHSGKRIYTSALYGGNESAEDVKDIYAQLDDLLSKTGSTRDHMVKATYYYSDLQSNGRLDSFRPKYYSPKTPPAASKARVKEVGKVGKGIAIDMICVTK